MFHLTFIVFKSQFDKNTISVASNIEEKKNEKMQVTEVDSNLREFIVKLFIE